MGSPRKKIKDYKGDLIPGRDRDGKILPGLTVASRKPRPIELMHLKVLCDVFTEKKFTEICQILLEECQKREPWAMKLLFDRLIPSDWLDRIKAEDRDRLRVIKAEYSENYARAAEAELRRQIKLATAPPEETTEPTPCEPETEAAG